MLDIHDLLTASTLTPREKGLVTRRCRTLGAMIDGAEDYLRDDALYHLAADAVHLRCVEGMQLALRLWEQIPLPKRARIERHAARWKATVTEERRRAEAQERQRATIQCRFQALRLVLTYGSNPFDPLMQRVEAAGTIEEQGAALIIWDMRPLTERETIITTAQRVIDAKLARDTGAATRLDTACLRLALDELPLEREPAVLTFDEELRLQSVRRRHKRAVVEDTAAD